MTLYSDSTVMLRSVEWVSSELSTGELVISMSYSLRRGSVAFEAICGEIL